MRLLHLVVAAILATYGSTVPLFDIPINTNAVIRSFIGGPEDGEERLFEDDEKANTNNNNRDQSAPTPYPFPILAGISRVFSAINNSTIDGVRNVAVAAFPKIFRPLKDQDGFQTEASRPNPQILKSFRIHANETETPEDVEDIGDFLAAVAEAKKDAAALPTPKSRTRTPKPPSPRSRLQRVAKITLPIILRARKGQRPFGAEEVRPNPEILKSLRIRAGDAFPIDDEDVVDLAAAVDEARRNAASLSKPMHRSVRETKTVRDTEFDPDTPFFGSIKDVAKVWFRSTKKGFRNFAKVAFAPLRPTRKPSELDINI